MASIDLTPPGHFTSRKRRKRLVRVPLRITGNGGTNRIVRVTRFNGAAQVGVQDVPGVWTLSAGGIDSAPFSADPFDLTLWISLLDVANLTVPASYSAEFQVQVLRAADSLILHDRNFPVTCSNEPWLARSIVFVLDRGSNMATLGPPPTSIERLRAVASRALGVLRDQDSLGIVRFPGSPALVLPLKRLDAAGPAPLPSHRAEAQRICSTAPPSPELTTVVALKSIQNAIDLARGIDPTLKVIVVTDGTTHPPPLRRPERSQEPGTYAVAITNGTSDTTHFRSMISSDGQYSAPKPSDVSLFMVEKHMTQILLDIGGLEPVLDPEGTLRPGDEMISPVALGESDHELELIVFADSADDLDVSLTGVSRNGPQGVREVVGKSPAVSGELGEVYQQPYPVRPRLPLDAPAERGQGVIVKRIPIDDPGILDRYDDIGVSVKRSKNAKGGPATYCLVVAAVSDARLTASLEASGLEVGSDLLFSAVLDEYGVPLTRPAQICVDLRHPDGQLEVIPLAAIAGSAGRFEAQRRTFRSGTYEAHFIAESTTLLKGRRFRREALRAIIISPAGSTSHCCEPPPKEGRSIFVKLRDWICGVRVS